MPDRSLNRIMFVEDDADIQAIAKIALESVGKFTIKICSSGPEALEAGPGFKPQLILLDMMIPGMDGITTLKALRDHPELKTVPVIFMTAKVQPSEVEQYKGLGALDVIRKPFQPLSLPKTILDIWNRAQT